MQKKIPNYQTITTDLIIPVKLIQKGKKNKHLKFIYILEQNVQLTIFLLIL